MIAGEPAGPAGAARRPRRARPALRLDPALTQREPGVPRGVDLHRPLRHHHPGARALARDRSSQLCNFAGACTRRCALEGELSPLSLPQAELERRNIPAPNRRARTLGGQ